MALGVFELRMLDYKVIDGATGLTSIEARVLDQNMINYYGLDNLYNKINSIQLHHLNWNHLV